MFIFIYKIVVVGDGYKCIKFYADFQDGQNRKKTVFINGGYHVDERNVWTIVSISLLNSVSFITLVCILSTP